MSVIDMTNLVAAMVASSGQTRLEVRDHRWLHEALASLSAEVGGKDGLPELRTTPDSEVGTRVRGVTHAIWYLHSQGAFEADESGDAAHYVAVKSRLEEFSKPIRDLRNETRDKILQSALDFGNALATDLKNSRRTV